MGDDSILNQLGGLLERHDFADGDGDGDSTTDMINSISRHLTNMGENDEPVSSKGNKGVGGTCHCNLLLRRVKCCPVLPRANGPRGLV